MTLLDIGTKRLNVTLVAGRGFQRKLTVNPFKCERFEEVDYCWLWFVMRVERFFAAIPVSQ